MEGNAGKGQVEDHARGRPDEDLASANNVDVLQRDEGEQEVGTGDDQPHRGWLIEPDLLE